MNKINYPAYSVLMSVYYKEKAEWLKVAINSMINQTVPPNEILLIQDGPITKELDKVINEYILNYPEIFKTISLSKNIGLGLALKKGIEECTYEYIARMDTDDYSFPDRIKKQFDVMFLQEVSLIGSNVIEFDKSYTSPISIRVLPEKHEDIIKFSKKRTPIAHPSVLFKKSDVINCGNYADSYLTEDYDIFIKLLRYGIRSYNIQEPLVAMRIGKEFYYRRGGLLYLVNILKFNTLQFKNKWFNIFDFIIRSFSNIIVCLVPNIIRDYIYRVFLRRGIKK